MNRRSSAYTSYLLDLLGECDYGDRLAGHKEIVLRLNEFVFSPALVLDSNRVNDVYYILRSGFSRDDTSGNVSVLEVLMALCIRFCEEIGEDVWIWQDAFWDCLMNLGLYSCDKSYFDTTDPSKARDYISERVIRFLNRDYEYDGSGGCFPLREPPEDQRTCDLWRQIGLYASEFMANYGFFVEKL